MDNNLWYLEFEIPDYSEITPEGKRILTEKLVRNNGIWKIHKNDLDNIFPDDPHADRVDAAEKLDIYTGKVYSKTTKKELRILPKKVMVYIYNEIMKCKEDIIKDKLIARRKDITYLN